MVCRDKRTGVVCRELLDQLERHNPKEQRVIYPHADDGLSTASKLRNGPIHRHRPHHDGWSAHHHTGLLATEFAAGQLGKPGG